MGGHVFVAVVQRLTTSSSSKRNGGPGRSLKIEEESRPTERLPKVSYYTLKEKAIKELLSVCLDAYAILLVSLSFVVDTFPPDRWGQGNVISSLRAMDHSLQLQSRHLTAKTA